jgi:hypothetical protein
MEADLVYYRRRSAQEAQAAAAALDYRVRQVHLDLSKRYTDRIAAIEVDGPHSHLRLVSAA